MSETFQPVRRITRVRTLGDAVRVPTMGILDEDDGPVVEPKSAAEMRADHEARRDSAPMTTRCAVDGCPWSHTGPAGECRDAAAAHRAAAHPELNGKRTSRKVSSRFGVKVDDTVIEDARKRRRDREQAEQLEKIERGRRSRGELLEEVAAAPGADGGAASSSSTPPPNEETNVIECKIDRCHNDASDAPKAGPTSRLCSVHRAERSAEMSARLRGKPRGGRTKTAPAPEPVPPPAADVELREAPPGHGSPLIRLLAGLTPERLAEAAGELEQMKRRLEAELALVDEAINAQRAA